MQNTWQIGKHIQNKYTTEKKKGYKNVTKK